MPVKWEDWLMINTSSKNLICKLAAYKISLVHTHVYNMYSVSTPATEARHNFSLD